MVLIGVVFLGVFMVIALVLLASGAGANQRTKQVLVHLDAALVSERNLIVDQAVDVRKNELLSAVPWINRLLLTVEVAPRLRTLLYQANLKWTAGGLLVGSIFLFLVVGYLIRLRSDSILLGLVIGSLVAGAPFVYVLIKRRRRFDKIEQELPEALDLMVGALRAGHSLVAALRLVAYESPDPLGGEFRICFDEQNYGLELRTALDNLVTRAPLQDLSIVVTAIIVQKESGGNLAEVLDKAAYVIRERFRLKRQVRVHTAQGRMTGWILSILPVALGLALYLVDPKTMSILWTRPIGVKLLYLSAAMTLAGGAIIRKIVNMEV